jgi:hypothetical protein
MKAYIEVQTGQEPEYHDLYHTDCGIINFDEDGWSGKIDDYWETFSPKYYLKPLPLEELMVGFTRDTAAWYKQDPDDSNKWYDTIEEKYFTTQELLTEYLKSKEIQK